MDLEGVWCGKRRYSDRIQVVAAVFVDFFKKIAMSDFRTVFDSYSIIYPITRPYGSFTILHINNKQRNVVANTYGAPPQNTNFPGRKQLLLTAFDRYILILTTISSRHPIDTLNINNKLQNAAADAYEASP